MGVSRVAAQRESPTSDAQCERCRSFNAMSGGHRPRVRCGLVHAGLAQGAEHFASGCSCAVLGHDHGQDSQMTLGRGFCCKSMHSPSPSAQCKGGVNACASSAHVWPHACASSRLWPPHINQSPFMKLGAVQVLEALAHDCFRLASVVRSVSEPGLLHTAFDDGSPGLLQNGAVFQRRRLATGHCGRSSVQSTFDRNQSDFPAKSILNHSSVRRLSWRRMFMGHDWLPKFG